MHLVERSVAQLRMAGITTGFLFTHVQNAVAQAFWHRLKWEHAPQVQYRFRAFD